MEPLDSEIAEKFRKWIVKFGVAFHVIAEILLLIASGYILPYCSEYPESVQGINIPTDKKIEYKIFLT
ncbi:MAG: hypothetical protein NUV86_04675 [Candidatus Scalindua sp.]|nr:hypothetical protein [Candidatus Scalindua sp.]